MEYVIICSAAFATSTLTLFSGFGLGTLLMPAFAIFFPVDIAITLTAIVHFLNNLFKFSLLGKYADRNVVLKFGIPAIVAAFLGAWVLIAVSDIPPLISYKFFGHNATVMPVKLAVALLMIFFALFETIPSFQNVSIDKKYLPLGGLLSGFFGGLSGNQGAFRSAFLVKCGLSKESFIGTGVIIVCLVDFSRLFVYSVHFASVGIQNNISLLLAATLSAFLGAWLGNRLVKKVTMRVVQIIVSILLFVIAIGLGSGVI